MPIGIPQWLMSFVLKIANPILIKPLLDAVKKSGYTETTEIQSKAIPVIKSGKDVIAFSLIFVNMIIEFNMQLT